MIKEKSVNYLLIILLIISVSANLLAWREIQNLDGSIKKLKTGNQTRGLELIENEYTKNLGVLQEGWKTYRNEEYGFEIKYPEEFESKEIEIKKVSFDSREDFYSSQKNEEVSSGVVPTFGSFKTARHLIDFNITENKMIERQVFKMKSSLFAIAIHPNKSNLPFEDFVSQEILSFYKGNEIIKEQRVVKINGVEGYRFACFKQGEIDIIYYLPFPDNKTVISIGTYIMLLDETLKSDDPYFEFSKINPQYQKELYDTENPIYYKSHSEFLEKYPDYENFLNRFSFEHTKKELNKRLLFEKIVYSFKFY